jgi:hypothetical protein
VNYRKLAPIGPDGSVGAALVTHATDPAMATARTIISPSCSTWLGLLGLVVFLICSRTPAQAQQFSADLVATADGAAATSAGTLRVFNGKVRIETPDFADGVFLIDGPNHAAYFARPAQRIFMDARQSSRLTRVFVPVDPADPCGQWQTMAKLAGAAESDDTWRCEREGEEVIDGRRAAAYRAILPSGKHFVGWIATDLKFPLRIEMEDGATVAVRNIHEGPQPAGLFEIPAGFRKFDPQALIERIKQSDVWVEPPPR